jgi:hypothetical protein
LRTRRDLPEREAIRRARHPRRVRMPKLWRSWSESRLPRGRAGAAAMMTVIVGAFCVVLLLAGSPAFTVVFTALLGSPCVYGIVRTFQSPDRR